MKKSGYLIILMLITAFLSLSCDKHNAKNVCVTNVDHNQEKWALNASSALITLNDKFLEYIDEKQNILAGYQSEEAACLENT